MKKYIYIRTVTHVYSYKIYIFLFDFVISFSKKGAIETPKKNKQKNRHYL